MDMIHGTYDEPVHTPCCGVPVVGDIVRGEPCQFCQTVITWCRGCGDGHSDVQVCEACGADFCDDCGPHREDDAPISLCSECCEPVAAEPAD